MNNDFNNWLDNRVQEDSDKFHFVRYEHLLPYSDDINFYSLPYSMRFGVYLEFAKSKSKDLLHAILWCVWNWTFNEKMDLEKAQKKAVKYHLRIEIQ